MWPGMLALPIDIVSVLNGFPLEPSSSDPNKEIWVSRKEPAVHASIEGFWSSRWHSSELSDGNWHVGTALIRMVGDWFHIEVQDETNQYVIRARQDDTSRLVGRYSNCRYYDDTSPWVGIIVGNSRIDGFWNTGRDRWDLRR